MRVALIPGVVALFVSIACGDGPTPTSPTVVSIGGTNPANPGGASTVGYVQDIKPLLDADCVTCHSGRNPSGRVDLSTYTTVLRTVTAGSANSLLIRETRQGGSMYREWRGDRDAKAALVRTWIVDFRAQENR